MNQLASRGVVEEEKILKLCRETVGAEEIFSACFYGLRIYGCADEKADINVSLIIPNYPLKISSFTKQINQTNLYILAIDKEVFENDVENGRFGELVAEIIALPYQPLINSAYLEEMEVKMKKRFVRELLENIILQYPELSIELLIKPEYFMHEVMRRRAKLFPPLMSSFTRMFSGKVKKQNVDAVMNGYLKALKELEREKYVTLSDGYVQIDKDFIETTKRKKNKFSNILISIQKTLLPHIRSISSRITTFSQNQRFFVKNSRKKAERQLSAKLEETERYLLMPTPLGPVPLSDKTDIQEFVRKTVPGGEELDITIEEMGGVLNSVFLLHLRQKHETQKIVVKKFEDWLGIKWFPLALWTLGTHSFAVLGETRLEREYSINQFLCKQGFTVPRILYVSLKERLIFEDFVEGEKLGETVKKLISNFRKESRLKDCEVLREVGKEIAKAHLLGISLGDCKPENILVTRDGKVCFLDLEQATRNGNQPWDIAEFLYYSGHYILPIHSEEVARIIASSFIEGYLEGGGKRENVRKAASAKYTKVFSLFTLPHVILIMANICKKMGEEKNE